MNVRTQHVTTRWWSSWVPAGTTVNQTSFNVGAGVGVPSIFRRDVPAPPSSSRFLKVARGSRCQPRAARVALALSLAGISVVQAGERGPGDGAPNA